MKRTIESLQNAFKTTERTFGPNNYYPFFLMKEDQQARIRFLPDLNEENPMGFLVEKVVHNLVVNGNKRKIPCLTEMFEEDCPICAVSQQFYKAGDDVNGLKYWKKREHLGQILIISDPLPADKESGETHEGKIRFINVGFQLYGIIKSAFKSGELDEVPYDYKKGYDFIIQKSPQGEWGTYALGSNFARRSTSLDDDIIKMVEENLVDLSTLLPPHPGLEKVESLLNAALTGEEYHEEGSSTTSFTNVIQDKMREGKETPHISEESEESEESVTTSSSVEESTPDELDSEADDIIAKIRSRRQKKS